MRRSLLRDQDEMLERGDRLVLPPLRGSGRDVSVVGESTSTTTVGSDTRSSSGASGRQVTSTSGYMTAVGGHDLEVVDVRRGMGPSPKRLVERDRRHCP